MERHDAKGRPGPIAALFGTAALLGGLGALFACNQHVFRVVPPDCVQQEVVEKDLEADVPTDILVVVDSSGSMCEEQANLVENFFDRDCPFDVDNVPEEYKNPTPEQVAELSQDCGFIQILAAYEKDYRLGVITTDVGPCDNRFGLAETAANFNCGGQTYPDWGRRPQRGCLQGYGENRKWLQKGDDAIDQKFQTILANIRTFGSAFERGLDAVEIFLDKDADKAPGCENDAAEFLRDDAKLVIIFLTDEEDCSHADGAYGFTDENVGESCDNDREAYYLNRDPRPDPEDCYAKPELLAPISRYVDFLRQVKGDDVSVAVIAGALREDNGTAAPAGCLTDPGTGQPVGQCHPSHGSSNLTAPSQPCHPDVLAEQGIDEPCCQADPGTRYFELARALGGDQSLTDSICYASFRNTMIDIANFIARDDFLRLTEPPANPGAILVKIRRAGKEGEEVLPRIPDGEDPTGKDGWQYDGGVEIRFYGSAVPQPGDSVYVAALSERENDTCSQAGAAQGQDAGP